MKTHNHHTTNQPTPSEQQLTHIEEHIEVFEKPQNQPSPATQPPHRQ